MRYSAAKHLASVTERLPSAFARQIIDAVVGNFDEHVVATEMTRDLSGVSEGAWHGSCLALAELARKRSIAADAIGSILPHVFEVGRLFASSESTDLGLCRHFALISDEGHGQ